MIERIFSGVGSIIAVIKMMIAAGGSIAAIDGRWRGGSLAIMPKFFLLIYRGLSLVIQNRYTFFEKRG